MAYQSWGCTVQQAFIAVACTCCPIILRMHNIMLVGGCCNKMKSTKITGVIPPCSGYMTADAQGPLFIYLYLITSGAINLRCMMFLCKVLKKSKD